MPTILQSLMKGRSMNKLQRDYLSMSDAEYEEMNIRKYQREQIAEWMLVAGWVIAVLLAVAVGVLIDWSWFGPEW